MTAAKESRLRGVASAALVAALFLVACALPAVHTMHNRTDPKTYSGRNVLYLGMLVAFLFGNLAWLANAFLASSMLGLLLRQWSLSALMAGVALGFGAFTFALYGKELPADQDGVNKLELVSLGPGYYCWLASMAVAFVAALLGGRAKKRLGLTSPRS